MAVNLRQEAKGRECQARVPGKCNNNPDTVVLCHLHKPSISGGMGLKANDFFAYYGCSACHNVLDQRDRSTVWGDWQLDIWIYEAILRTQKILLDEGKIGML
jgi:hypothetical protein